MKISQKILFRLEGVLKVCFCANVHVHKTKRTRVNGEGKLEKNDKSLHSVNLGNIKLGCI